MERQFDMQFLAQSPGSPIVEDVELYDKEVNKGECTSYSVEELVVSVNAGTREGQFLLVFKDMEKVARGIIVVRLMALQQWNRGLRQCFEQAGWSLGPIKSQRP